MSETPEFQFDPSHNGVYAAPHALAAWRDAAAAQGLAWCDLDLSGISTKPAFLARAAAALCFPEGFGHNWDALADCLEDLSWQPSVGVIAHWTGGGEFSRRASEDYSIALDICAAASSYWQARSRVMLVLLDAQSRGGRALPALPRQ
jgi:hypothetical protein